MQKIILALIAILVIVFSSVLLYLAYYETFLHNKDLFTFNAFDPFICGPGKTQNYFWIDNQKNTVIGVEFHSRSICGSSSDAYFFTSPGINKDDFNFDINLEQDQLLGFDNFSQNEFQVAIEEYSQEEGCYNCLERTEK